MAPGEQRPGHIVLLGDSIFDNAAYTRGAPDVVTHLQRLLPSGWRATSLAVDGATTADLASQLRRVPADATHLAIAIGGNDALQNSDLLSLRVTSSAQALEVFAERVAEFDQAYRAAIRAAAALGHPTAVCTVYNGALEEDRARIARVALALFNDVIFREAFRTRIPVIDLRLICTQTTDYADISPIEPSVQGGDKITTAIVEVLTRHDFSAGQRVVYA